MVRDDSHYCVFSCNVGFKPYAELLQGAIVMIEAGFAEYQLKVNNQTTNLTQLSNLSTTQTQLYNTTSQQMNNFDTTL